MKLCTKCKKTKSRDNFTIRKNRNNILVPWCKSCVNQHSKDYRLKHPLHEKERHKIYRIKNRELVKIGNRRYNLKKLFNIDIKQYNDLLKKQNNRCAICGVHQSKLNKQFAVDHEHSTGKVRGLLCIQCNLGIGNFKDSTIILKKAISYLTEEIVNG